MTTAMCRVRKAPLLACAVLPAVAWAARGVPVFEVDVGGQTVPALQQAMRAALVRATGRRQTASDPAFASLIEDAPKYVEGYQRGSEGELQVVFNGAAVDKAIAALDRSIWDPERPFTLIVLYPPPDQADQATDEAGLEQAAEERGLPISIVPLPVADSSGNLLSRDALLEMAHRYGAEQLLIGRPPVPAAPPAPSTSPPPQSMAAPSGAAASTPSPPEGGPAPSVAAAPALGAQSAPSLSNDQWQWTLYTGFASQSWNGPLTAGIDDTVDLLAPPPGASAGEAAGEAQVEIEGVTSLADYANIESMLGAVPGVSEANVREVDGSSVLFELTALGGTAAVDRALSSSPSFSRVGSSGGRLIYRYRPG